MANRADKSGINADMQKKLERDYDPQQEAKAREWMEKIVGEPLEGEFYSALQDGSYLCKLFNKLFGDEKPVIPLKHTKRTTQNFMQIDNIEKFLTACKKFGMDEKDLCVTLDLQELQNKNMVLSSIFNLGRHMQKVMPDSDFPVLGPKEAELNPRYHDEKKTKEGRAISTMQMGTNKVASQQGMTAYGAPRQIYDPKTAV